MERYHRRGRMSPFMRLRSAPFAALVVVVPLMALLASDTARAEAAPESLTLRDAIARAAAGNVDLRKQNGALRAAAANVVAALGQFDVVLAGDASLTHNVVPPLRNNDPASGSTTSPVFDVNLSRV